MRAGYFELPVAGPRSSHLKPPHTRFKPAVVCFWILLVLFLGWGIAMTAVYASRSTVCDTATTCAALGLPASMCDASGVIYGSACASSADCAHADTCCLNATGTSVKACSTTNQTACLKNSTASTHGVCKAIEENGGMEPPLPDVFITCEESGYCPRYTLFWYRRHNNAGIMYQFFTLCTNTIHGGFNYFLCNVFVS